MEKRLIDIIIPAYNAHNTLSKALASIAMQTMSNEINVLVINDCSKNDYSDIIKPFQKCLNIIEIKHEKNMGPGEARNTGIQYSLSPYITFMDADDVFYDNLSLEILYNNIIKDEQYNAVYGEIVQINKNYKDKIINSRHFVWIFGSLFKSSFIKEQNIHFPNTYAEDVSFNKQVKLLSKVDQLCFINHKIYKWTDSNEKNRINNKFFQEVTGKLAYAKMLLPTYTFLETKKLPCTNEELKFDYLSNLTTLFFLMLSMKNEYARQIIIESFSYIRKYAKQYQITQEEAIFAYEQNYFIYYQDNFLYDIYKNNFCNFIQIINTFG